MVYKLKAGYRQNDSPGFISREWIETYWSVPVAMIIGILPALLVGSGLKPVN